MVPKPALKFYGHPGIHDGVIMQHEGRTGLHDGPNLEKPVKLFYAAFVIVHNEALGDSAVD